MARMRRMGWLAGVILGAGCGGGAAPPDPTASTAQFIQLFAKGACEWELRCCTDDELKVREGGKYTDVASCMPFQELQLESGTYEARLLIKKGRLKLDDKLAQACIAALESQPCEVPGTLMRAPMGAPTPDACLNVFSGTTKIGDECSIEIANQCVDHARCVQVAGNGTGVCVPFQEENEICNSPDDCDPLLDPVTLRNNPMLPFFRPGLYCSGQDFKCHKPAKLGDPCALSPMAMIGGVIQLPLIECEATAFCDGSTCRHFPGPGEPCITPRPDLPFQCDPDPVLKLTCTQVPTPSGLAAVCMGPGKLGDACFGNGAGPCEDGLICAQPMNFGPPVCSMPKMVGDDCHGPQECGAGLFCQFPQPPFSGPPQPKCAEQKTEGQPCNDPQSCMSGMCFSPPNGGPATCQAGNRPQLCTGR